MCTLSNQSCRQQINLMSDTRHKTCRLAVERGIVDEGAGGEIACAEKRGGGGTSARVTRCSNPYRGLKMKCQ